MLLGDNNGVATTARSKLNLISHQEMENYLGRYSGLMLYLKEMDEKVYAKLCAVCALHTCPNQSDDIIAR